MTEAKAKKIFDKYNPAADIKRCPNGRAKMRKPLDLYAKAATNLYGIISRDEFVEIFNAQNEEQTTADEVYTILLPNVIKHGWYGFYKDYIVHYMVLYNFDYADALAEHQDGKPRYVPSKEQFLKFEWEDYEDNDYWYDVRKFMWKAFGTTVKTSEAFGEVKQYFSHGTGISRLGPIMDKYDLVFSGEKQLQQFMDLVMNAKNNSRIWENKGYTPNELREILDKQRAAQPHKPKEIVVHQPKKVGRNDPCPCGSGKKFKKCCALLETTGAAQVPHADRKLFYETWYKLLDYVNRKLKVVNYEFSLKYPDFHDETLLHKIRERIWAKPKLIGEFIADKTKPHTLTTEETALLESWQQRHIKGEFILLKYLPDAAVLMRLEKGKEQKLYAVKGMTTSIAEAMHRRLPVMMEVVLLPFKDVIIYDGFMMSNAINFGGGAVEMFADEYAKAEKQYGIITKL